jgi:uncharacterized protein
MSEGAKDPSEVPKPRKELTVSQAGRIGGIQRMRNATPEERSALARKGGQATKRKYGKDYFRMIGKAGGQTTRRKNGDEFFQENGRKGGNRLKELVEKGKEAIAKEATHESKHSNSD